ncbi:hypothetical protein LCGC14_2779140, partial [marine sediment metagenome]
SVRRWMLPTTLYDQIAEYVMDEEWADILEPKTGTAFNCKREGSGLDTVYTAKVQREPYPVNPALMKQVADPEKDMVDPGLKSQCEELGYEISELFDDSELEASSDKSGKKKDKAKSKSKSKSKAKSKKKKTETNHPADDNVIDVGAAVLYEDEEIVYHVNKIDGDDVVIEDGEGNEYDATMDQLKLHEEDEPEPEIEVSSEVHYSGEKEICVVKSIDGEDVVIEDADGEQYDVKMEELALAATPF